MRIKKNRVVFFSVIAAITVLLATLFSRIDDYRSLISGAVNPENGDVTVAYFDTERSGVSFVTYDAQGNKLYGKFIDTEGGGVRLAYEGGVLHVYIYRKNAVSIYNREGALVKKLRESEMSERQKEQMHADAWEHWDKGLGTYTYYDATTNLKYIYRTKITIIEKSKCILYIEALDGTQIVCYQDNWN